MTTMDDLLRALEEAAAVQGKAIGMLVDTVRALTVVNAALITQLATSEDRAVIRAAALSVLPNEADRPAAALVEMLTCEPSELAAEQALFDVLSRLH